MPFDLTLPIILLCLVIVGATILVWKNRLYTTQRWSNFLDWFIMRTIWSIATYKPETNISELLHSQSDAKKVKIVSIQPKLPSMQNQDDLLEMYQKPKCTIMTLNDAYARFRTSYVPYSVYFDEIGEENVEECEKLLIEGLEKTLFYFPTVGGRYRDLDPNSEQDLKLLNCEKELNLVNGRRKPFLVISHENPILNVAIIRKKVGNIENESDLLEMENELVFKPEIKSPYSDKELSRVQISFLQLDNGRVVTVIALALNHSIGGAEIGHYFLKCWGELTRGMSLSQLPSMSRVGLILPKEKIDPNITYTHQEFYKFHKYVFNMLNCIRQYKVKARRLNISKQHLEILKQNIKNSTTGNSIISTNDVISAILFSMMAYTDPTQPDDTLLSFRMVCNFRFNYPPLRDDSKMFVGNPLSNIWITLKKSEIRKMKLVDMVLEIRKQVNDQNTEKSTERFIQEMSKSFHDEEHMDRHKVIIDDARVTFSITNWVKYDFLNDINYGMLGKPRGMVNFESMGFLHHAFLHGNTRDTLQLGIGLTDLEWKYLHENYGDLFVMKE